MKTNRRARAHQHATGVPGVAPFNSYRPNRSQRDSLRTHGQRLLPLRIHALRRLPTGSIRTFAPLLGRHAKLRMVNRAQTHHHRSTPGGSLKNFSRTRTVTIVKNPRRPQDVSKSFLKQAHNVLRVLPKPSKPTRQDLELNLDVLSFFRGHRFVCAFGCSGFAWLCCVLVLCVLRDF